MLQCVVISFITLAVIVVPLHVKTLKRVTMGLHERKKHHDPENPDENAEQQTPSAPTSGGGAQRVHVKKGLLYKSKVCFGPEIRYALLVVASFMTLGVMLGYFMLHHQHRKVILHIMHDPVGHVSALSGRVGFRHHFYTGHPRTVTVVMPSVVNPSKRTQRLESILATWGPSARAVYVVHNVTEFPRAAHAVMSEESAPEDPYSYPQLMLVPSSIGVDDGVPRLNHVIRSVYEKINPDFAFFVNDHTFVIPEHLCYFLREKDPDKDMYAGHAMKNNQKDVFNSGAAGYVLSRQTMKRLVEKWDEDDPLCSGKNGDKWLQGNPGLVTSNCLWKLGIQASDTRHDQKDHRFHAFPLVRMVAGKVDQWYLDKHNNMDNLMDTDESYNTLLSGSDCCAQSTVSFHYVEFMESLAFFATREALLENPHMTEKELKHIMMAEWPKTQKEVGGYSRGLPGDRDEDAWKPLLHTMRKISSRYTQRDC